MIECAHRGKIVDGRAQCRAVGGTCSPDGSDPKLPDCGKCDRRLPPDDPGFAAGWIDPLVVVDRNKAETSCLRGMLAGRPSFLVCGGPSADEAAMETLGRRGCWSLAVNNKAGHSRWGPQAFVCSDPPMTFSHSIWLDPRIMKFVPTPKMSGKRQRLRGKFGGVFRKLDETVSSSPNVWGFRRESWMEPGDAFFTAEGACWGNQDAGVARTGQPKTVCTMLLGLRLLYYLGSRRIYLVGVDFRMSPDYGYSFAQARDEGAARSNNEHYRIVNSWLCQMQERGTFARFSLELFNCHEQSGLRAFPHVPLAEAVADAAGVVEEVPDLERWYEKDSCPKCGSWSVRWLPGGGCRCEDCREEWTPKPG